jgi:hypothetical protein
VKKERLGKGGLFLGQQTKNRRIWQWASLFMLLVLMVQIGYFEVGNLIRQPKLRSTMLQVCEFFHCRLPVYKNLQDWTVSHSALTERAGHQFLFRAAMTNEAEFPQAFPDLKLTLTDFNGQPVAERIFTVAQYANTADNLLAANETIEIHLNLAAPKGKVGGFAIKLL